jgi:hypothetical protein
MPVDLSGVMSSARCQWIYRRNEFGAMALDLTR